jgi:hypothetical protein
LPADVVHPAVVAHVQLGGLESGREHQTLAEAVDDGPARALDPGLQGVTDATVVVVGQGINIEHAFRAGHAREVRVLDHLERAREELQADAELVEAKAGGLDHDDQIARGQAFQRAEHGLGRGGVEREERRAGKTAPVGLRQGQRQVGARVGDHQARAASACSTASRSTSRRFASAVSIAASGMLAQIVFTDRG